MDCARFEHSVEDFNIWERNLKEQYEVSEQEKEKKLLENIRKEIWRRGNRL